MIKEKVLTPEKIELKIPDKPKKKRAKHYEKRLKINAGSFGEVIRALLSEPTVNKP